MFAADRRPVRRAAGSRRQAEASPRRAAKQRRLFHSVSVLDLAAGRQQFVQVVADLSETDFRRPAFGDGADVFRRLPNTCNQRQAPSVPVNRGIHPDS